MNGADARINASLLSGFDLSLSSTAMHTFCKELGDFFILSRGRQSDRVIRRDC